MTTNALIQQPDGSFLSAPIPEPTPVDLTDLTTRVVQAEQVAAGAAATALTARETASDAQVKVGAATTVAAGADSKAQSALDQVAKMPTVQAAKSDDILLDSFTGTDDERLTQALKAAAASSPRKAIRLAGRAHTFTQTRQTFSGLRILGPNVGWQNPEISGTSGSLPQCTVTLNCGNGASSWLVGTSTTYNVTVAGITFKSSNGVSQFYHHPYSAGTSYATRLDTLSFYGFKHVLGTPADPFSMTLNTWAGDWTLVAVQDTQFSLRGSDNWLKPTSMNYGWAGANGGRYLMRFSNLAKTAVANLYLTARGGSRAILVEGPASQQGGLDFTDCVIEGQNAGDPAMGALIVVKGGGVSFTNTKLNFGMARPGDFTDQKDTALIMVMGGVCVLENTWTNKATATPATVPVVDTLGGTCYVGRIIGMGGATVTTRQTSGLLKA